MKAKFNTFGIVILTLTLLLAARPVQAGDENKVGTPDKTLTVTEVMSNPAKFLDKNIKVRCNIVAVDTEKSLIMLEDADCSPKVPSDCGPKETSGCVNLRLPAKYSSGTVPSVGSAVIVSGKVSMVGGKFSFDVTEIARKD
ncbi:MAG: hypothetical protein Q8O19_03190 [Rectinemataceae bacterium]|nr:hypothetical protein [Rectinemataceae bacterium]